MRQPWLYFCYRFDILIVNSLTLWIPLVSSHSVFRDDFLVYSDSVFADDLRISSGIAFLTITCVSHDSNLAINLMCWSWIHLRCRFHMSSGTQFSKMISISIGNKFSLTIYGSVVTWHFWQFLRHPWLYFGYRFDASVLNSLTMSIPYVARYSVFIDDL